MNDIDEIVVINVSASLSISLCVFDVMCSIDRCLSQTIDLEKTEKALTLGCQ